MRRISRTCTRTCSRSDLVLRRTALPRNGNQTNALVMQMQHHAPSMQTVRYFATEETKKDAKEQDDGGDSLRDTVNRINKSDKEDDTSSSSSSSSDDNNDLFRRAADTWQSFTAEVGVAWEELTNSGQSKDINKQVGKVEAYTGPVDIMVIDESEGLTAWERMQRRLTEAPIIQGILEKGDQVLEQAGAKKVKKQVDELSEDAREAWETSQNPWVYRISSVYDTVTAESEEAAAVRDLRVMDPTFNLEEWKHDVVEHTLPKIMSWFLEGELERLQPWMAEGVFKRIAAEVTARKQEGVQINTHVLAIMNSEILAIEKDHVEKGSPIILLHYMCQQINCVTKKKDGTIVEGSEDDIRANSYVVAFQREYNDEEGALNWRIVDFRFNGAIAYL